jgi:GMP synthase (glutamine-hydrolysing)
MRKIVIFQHVGHEPLGSLNPLLKTAGFRIRYVNFGRSPDTHPSLEGYNGLIVLGGPMGVYEVMKHPHIKTELTLIEAALKKNIPVLGICLGAQMIAHVLGAEVKRNRISEFGWYDVTLTPEGARDPLFNAWKKKEKIFQAHQDTFTLPFGTKHLASSPACENQAFVFGEKVYGFQFHLEVDRAMIHRWLGIASNQILLAHSAGSPTPDSLDRDTSHNIQRSDELSTETFSRFIDLFQLKARPVLLGSDHGKPLDRVLTKKR